MVFNRAIIEDTFYNLMAEANYVDVDPLVIITQTHVVYK